MTERKRKPITCKTRMEVLKRDHFTCQSCGRSPAFYPGIEIDVVKFEVDHVQPFSKDGADDLLNYQTLYQQCNRGKGNDELLNRVTEDKLIYLLNAINKQILIELEKTSTVSVVATDLEFRELVHLNNLSNTYTITPTSNTIIGLGAMKNIGIYTLNDDGGTKIHFHISKNLKI